MTESIRRFRHNSLQDADSVVDLLEALTKGLNSGKLQLTDDDGTLQMKPRGLLELAIDAECSAGLNTLNLRLRWNDSARKVDQKSLKIRT